MEQKRFLGLLSGTTPLFLADDPQMQGQVAQLRFYLGFRVSGFRVQG